MSLAAGHCLYDGFLLESARPRRPRRVAGVLFVSAAHGRRRDGGTASQPSKLYLGYIGPLSGGNAELGRSGAMRILAVQECNDGGGIQGHLVELLIRDDAEGPRRLGEIIMDFGSGHVQASVGPMTNDAAILAAVESQRHNTLLMSPTIRSDELTGRDDWFFSLYPACTQMMEHLARRHAGRRTAWPVARSTSAEAM